MPETKRIHRFGVVESTNDEIRRLGLAGAPDGTIAVAAEQRAGRGRRGRVWHSPCGGLWMSVLVRPGAKDIARLPALSIAAGVAAADALEKVFVELGLPPDSIGLSWPNDVLVDMKKIAGILCEATSVENSIPFVAIGIGINVNNSPEQLPAEIQEHSTSVKSLSGNNWPIEKMLEIITIMIDNRIAEFKSGSLDNIIAEWRKRAVLFGRNVILQSPDGNKRKVVPVDIDNRGRLIVHNDNGSTESVEFEETTLIR